MTTALEQSDSPATVVVGAGHGGGTLAAQLRQQGYRGQIILVGAEPHLPYHRPPLSKKFLSGQYEQWLRPDDFYTSQDIDVRVNTTVSAIDRPARRIITASGVEIGYEHLVLATGATARKLDVPGGSLERILTLRNLDDAAQLRRIVPTAGNVVIVGGGYVGLEVAAEISARSAAKVTVLEREHRILARVASPTFSDLMHRQHASRGIEILTETDVVGFSGDSNGAVSAVRLSNGDEITCGAVLVGVGAVPCDGLARSAGLLCDKGIVVDGESRSSDRSIFAIGDVSQRSLGDSAEPIRLESIPNAVEQAKQVAAAITGSPIPRPEVPWFWSDQFDLQLKIAGLIRADTVTAVRGDPDTGKFAIFHLDQNDTVVAVETSNSPQSFMAGKKAIADRSRAVPGLLSDPAVGFKECFVSQ